MSRTKISTNRSLRIHICIRMRSPRKIVNFAGFCVEAARERAEMWATVSEGRSRVSREAPFPRGAIIIVPVLRHVALSHATPSASVRSRTGRVPIIGKATFSLARLQRIPRRPVVSRCVRHTRKRVSTGGISPVSFFIFLFPRGAIPFSRPWKNT